MGSSLGLILPPGGEVNLSEKKFLTLPACMHGCTDSIALFRHLVACSLVLSDPMIESLPRRKTVVRQRSSNLPNMFQQQEKREQELQKQRQLGVAAKESIPMDKKIFTNFLDKFEDENSRRGAKEEIQKLTFRQKDHKASWSKREEEKLCEHVEVGPHGK